MRRIGQQNDDGTNSDAPTCMAPSVFDREPIHIQCTVKDTIIVDVTEVWDSGITK